jgi:hypothetical protein
MGLHLVLKKIDRETNEKAQFSNYDRRIFKMTFKQPLAHPVLGNVNAGRAKIRRNAVSSNGQIGGLEKKRA